MFHSSLFSPSDAVDQHIVGVEDAEQTLHDLARFVQLRSRLTQRILQLVSEEDSLSEEAAQSLFASISSSHFAEVCLALSVIRRDMAAQLARYQGGKPAVDPDEDEPDFIYFGA